MPNRLQIEGIFKKLRENELSGSKTSDLDLLDDIKEVIKKQRGFVLGCFTFTEHSIRSHTGTSAERKFWPDTNPPLFFSDIHGSNNEFCSRANAAFGQLVSENLFISALIHQLDDKRAKRVELIHRRAPTGCIEDIHIEECTPSCVEHLPESNWVLKSLLGDLSNSFSKTSDKAIACKYAEVVKGYFPTDANFLIVYCPFFVPDGKPPGNFFGVFECSNKCGDLLGFLSTLQLAGTLVFSRKAVDAKLENMMTEVNRLRGVLEPIQEMTFAINNLEGVMNPKSLVLGDEEYQRLKKARPRSWGSTCHDCQTWADACQREFLSWLAQQSDVLSQLRVRLGDERYKKYFPQNETMLECELPSDQIKQTGAIFKYFLQGSCPCTWVGIDANRAIEISSEEVSPLNFCLAIEALGSYCKASLTNTTEVKIDVSVTMDERGVAGLTNLLGGITVSEAADVRALYKGNTTSAIALLAKAAKCKVIPFLVEGNKLVGRLTYSTKKYV